MTSSRALAPLLTLALVSACSDSGGGGGVDAPGGGPDGGGDVDAAIPAGYTRLIGRTWTLPGGQPDTYKCVRVTMTQDVYITGFRAQAPQGTHHTVLSIATNGRTQGPDGEYDCAVGTLGLKMLFASGVGTADYDLPAGVAVKVAAGEQVHLNLHLYNTSDQPISGDSGILVKTVPTAPANLAEFVFAGKFLFQVPANPAPYTVTGGCTIAAGRNYQLFALWPHMHQIATHQKVSVIRGGTPTVLHDGAFSFGEQDFFPQTPEVNLVGGDQIRVECTYENTTGAAVPFGDSSDSEMCFAGLYRYPATGSNLFECTDNPTGVGL